MQNFIAQLCAFDNDVTQLFWSVYRIWLTLLKSSKHAKMSAIIKTLNFILHERSERSERSEVKRYQKQA
jgi:hypothetical protein